MRRSLPFLPVAALALLGFTLFGGDAPDGWHLAGDHRDAYAIGVTDDADRAGAVAYLASTAPAPEGFGTLMQTFEADAFRGKRLRMTAHVRTEDVTEWAGLWVRVDGAGATPQPLAFDNMDDRPISGTTAWAAHSVVLDVPTAAAAVSFGVLLNGPGRVLLDDVTFEEVDESVPVTGPVIPGGPDYPARPMNLDFEG